MWQALCPTTLRTWSARHSTTFPVILVSNQLFELGTPGSGCFPFLGVLFHMFPPKKIKAWEYVRQETLDDRQKILNQQALVAGFSWVKWAIFLYLPLLHKCHFMASAFWVCWNLMELRKSMWNIILRMYMVCIYIYISIYYIYMRIYIYIYALINVLPVPCVCVNVLYETNDWTKIYSNILNFKMQPELFLSLRE